MTPAGELLMLEARRRFARLVAQPEASIDLAHAALLVAAEEKPGLDVEHYRARLYELGVTARERIAARDSDSIAVVALNKFIFEELGFAGNQSEYYDPRNSLLSEVLERRTGIPITLSMIYMEIGRRAGLHVEGIGLPGHFIVRAGGERGESALVDPFNAKIIDVEDCQERLDTIYGGQAPLTDAHLRPATTREILARLLRNLKGIYAQAGLYRRALSIIERIMLVAPNAAEERRDRGALLAQLGRYAEAIVDVQAYLKSAPAPPDAERVAEQLKRMQTQLARLN
ncbi:MAG TPA: transglutaminase-like domain-containing protein [Pyrinomonadaceae bacterium]|nr:transglutaminase-like domain-containing protein [Pyrinomonadaceae bacterium]